MNLAQYKATTKNIYVLTSDEIAGGANKAMLNLFNGYAMSSAAPKKIALLALYVDPKSDVAVSGVVSARFNLYRTSTAGTGGTAFAYGSTDPAALNIRPFDTAAESISGSPISARTAPTGGNSKSAFLWSNFIFTEETSAGALLQGVTNLLPDGDYIPPFILNPGEGLFIEQGSVASVNNFVFKLIFAVVDA